MAEVRKNTVHPLHIEGYTAEGMGVARLDGRVVFIPGTIRGEDWEVQLLKVNKGVAWGKGTRLISPSPVRQEPDCPYSGRCGGCQYRHMSYEEELAAKGQRVRDGPTPFPYIPVSFNQYLFVIHPPRSKILISSIFL